MNVFPQNKDKVYVTQKLSMMRRNSTIPASPKSSPITLKKVESNPETNIPSQEDELLFYKNWARFTDIMQVQPGQNSENWANNLLGHLIPFVQGYQATFYMKTSNEMLELIGCYAVATENLRKRIKIGESTVGQVAKTRQANHIVNPVAKNNFKAITTQNIPVHSILTLPVTHQDEVQGVLEILFFQPIASQHLNFLHRISSNMGTNLCLLANARIREANDMLNQQLNASEEFRKLHSHLTEGINYASNIQAAILPNSSSFEKVFQDHFIIYKPKDIVSGDFYWLTQITNCDTEEQKTKKTTFVAVVDCTGHGVPGAFMSIIGTTLLNEIVNKKGVTNPAQILKMMHIGVRSRLKQSEGQNKDGMDICLCKIEKTCTGKSLITYAGAKRPLYYIQDYVLRKLKGNRRSIGGENQFQQKAFENETIELSPGDKLFLSSDGFKDMANSRRKSFGLRKLEKLLQMGAKYEMQKQQEQLTRVLDEYQQNTPQRDDVTLLGIQI